MNLVSLLPFLAAPGQHRVLREAVSPPRLQQRLNHKRGRLDQVPLDQRSRDPQDTKTSAGELPISRSVVSALLFVASVPVNLDDERRLTRHEVDDVIAENNLTAKLHAEQPATTHEAPHECLGVSGRVPHRPSALFEERLSGGTLS